VPRVEQVEALTREAQYFVDCVFNKETPLNDGRAGLRLVQMLEAIDQSMSHKGKMVYCSPAAGKSIPSQVTA
jgi:predicted dehydrogenase